MITQDTIQQIQNRIDIIDVVGEFVKLKKRGANYLGLCPFHNEKTPSFTVSQAKEIYKCFGCGRSGNTIGFLMEHEKFSYVEALRWLAGRYGIEVGETETSPEYQKAQQVVESLQILNQYAQKYFSKTLHESEEGQAVGLSYLEQRGFREDIIRKFQLGYCLEDRDAFARTALGAQFNQDLLLRSGLVVMRGEQPADNYRGRIIFPVHNHSGKVLGFGARQIRTNDRSPKYINTPENEVYVKSKLLYGLHFARQAIDRQDECLLVEGYTDVISLHQAGVENVVASGGTSLTQDQLRLIKKYTDNLTIIYDGDAAGIKAALRGLDMALEERLHVSLVLIPDKEDPDSYMHKVGPEEFRAFVAANKKDFIYFQLDVALKDAGDDPRKKAAIVSQIAETLARIDKTDDFTSQQDYIRRSAEILKIDEAGLNALVNKHIRERIGKLEARGKSSVGPGGWKAPGGGAGAPTGAGGPGSAGGGNGAGGMSGAVGAGVAGPSPADGQWGSRTSIPEGESPLTPEEKDAFDLLNQEEANERALMRVLLEHGGKSFDDEGLVADYIFRQFEDADLFDNKTIYHLFDLYREHYRKGSVPDTRTFLYHPDPSVSALVVGLTETRHELSDRWHKRDADLDYDTIKKGYLKYLGKSYVVKEEKADQERYKEEVRSTVTYMQLKKIKKLIQENQKDMERPHTPEELALLKDTHRHLKDLEIELTSRLGTVILK